MPEARELHTPFSFLSKANLKSDVYFEVCLRCVNWLTSFQPEGGGNYPETPTGYLEGLMPFIYL